MVQSTIEKKSTIKKSPKKDEPYSSEEIKDYNIVLDWLLKHNQYMKWDDNDNPTSCTKKGDTYQDLVERIRCFTTAGCACPSVAKVSTIYNNERDDGEIEGIYFDNRQCDGFMLHDEILPCNTWSGHKVKYIPKEIQVLKKLRFIDLGITTFTSLPKELENVDSLRDVMFWGPRTNFSKKAMKFYNDIKVDAKFQFYVYRRESSKSKFKLEPEKLIDPTL